MFFSQIKTHDTIKGSAGQEGKIESEKHHCTSNTREEEMVATSYLLFCATFVTLCGRLAEGCVPHSCPGDEEWECGGALFSVVVRIVRLP